LYGICTADLVPDRIMQCAVQGRVYPVVKIPTKNRTSVEQSLLL